MYISEKVPEIMYNALKKFGIYYGQLMMAEHSLSF